MAERYPRHRGTHPYDEQVRQLLAEGLSVAKIVEQSGISYNQVTRAVRRSQIGVEAELAERRNRVNANRARKRERDQRLESRRKADRERVKEWRRTNPERHRERTQRWALEHPQRRREIERASYERNKENYRPRMRAYDDAHVDEKRERGAKWRAENKEHLAQLQRDYRADPTTNAKVLENNRVRRRLIRRLKKAGLPPKSLHPVTAAVRRNNEKEADAFFTRKRTAEERRRIKQEYTPTPPELIARWEQRSQLVKARRRELEAVKAYLAKHEAALRDEATLDSRARIARGATPLDVEEEVARRAREAVRRTCAMKVVRDRESQGQALAGKGPVVAPPYVRLSQQPYI
jgi:hypothetical protein